MELIEQEFERLYRILNGTQAETDAAIDAAVAAAGNVSGPSSSVDGAIVAFSGVTGKLIRAATLAELLTLLGTVPVANGGTGLTSYTQGDVLYASASGTLSKLAKSTTATRYLSNTGSSNNPAWAQVDLATGVTGSLPLASLPDLAGLSVLGRSANSSGVMAAITAASDGDVLRRAGTAVGFGQIATAGITDAAVTLAKMADLAQATVIGRAAAAGTGVPQALTGAQLLTIIGSLSGAVGAIYQYAGNPQANLAAPAPYSVCVNTLTGNWFRKLGGGSTVYGWYHWQSIGADGFGPDLMGFRLTESTTASVANGFIGMQTGAASVAAGSVNNFINNRNYKNLLTSSVSGNISFVRGANTGRDTIFFGTDFDYVARLAIPTSIASLRFHTGIFTTTLDDNPNASADAAGTSYIMARYDAATDSGWSGRVKNGANNVSNTAALATLNTGSPTETVVRIRKVSGVCYFSVDDGTELSINTNVPTAVAANLSTSVTTKTTAAKELWIASTMLTLGVI